MSREAEPARTVSWRGPARGSPAALELALAELRRGISPHGLDLREAAEGERAELILGDDLSVRAGAADEAASTLDSPSLLAGLARLPAGRGEGRGIAVELAAGGIELDWHAALRTLGAGPLEIVAAGAAASERASEVLRGLERARRLDVGDGAGLAAAIAGRRLVIASSLEVALVALARGVPFLLARSGEAPPAVLADRGLGSWTFAAADELVGKARTMLAIGLDLGPLVRRDAAALESRLARLARELGGATGVPAASATEPSAVPPPALHGGVAARGDDEAERIARNLRPMIERLGGDLHRLHHEVASQRARIGELAGEVDRQSGEIARREALLRDILESRAWRLVSRLREALASVRRALGGAGRAKDVR